MPVELRQEILAVCQGQSVSLSQIGQLDHRLGLLFADAVNHFLEQQQLDPSSIAAVGCHGQTLWHEPSGAAPFTYQAGDNNLIAARTGITTVGDFRRKDMAYGGQGAPLVPAFHEALLTSPDKRRIIVNIGGIANVSVLCPSKPTLGFDTGPGNVLMDAWIAKHLGHTYDKDAAWAKQGTASTALLEQLTAHTYFARLPPKSTGVSHPPALFVPPARVRIWGCRMHGALQPSHAVQDSVSIAFTNGTHNCCLVYRCRTHRCTTALLLLLLLLAQAGSCLTWRG